jgi:hypothetical protein
VLQFGGIFNFKQNLNKKYSILIILSRKNSAVAELVPSEIVLRNFTGQAVVICQWSVVLPEQKELLNPNKWGTSIGKSVNRLLS